jgi:hypothetical protein
MLINAEAVKAVLKSVVPQSAGLNRKVAQKMAKIEKASYQSTNYNVRAAAFAHKYANLNP